MLPRATTDNLMDYNNGSRLIKPQWDLIHNPEVTTGLLDDESEGASLTYEEIVALNYKEEIVSFFYKLISRKVISQSELVYLNGVRPSSEKRVIEDCLRNLIFVNPYVLDSVYISIPKKEDDFDIVGIGKKIFSDITDELTPILLQTGGLATEKFGESIGRAAISKLSFELFKKRLGYVSNLGPAKNALRISKFAKFGGKTLKYTGALLKRLGGALLWYDLLTFDSGPGEITDERIERSTIFHFSNLFNKVKNEK